MSAAIVAGAMGAGVLGDIYQSETGRRERKDATRDAQRRLDAINQIPQPDIRRYELERFRETYNFTPEDMQVVMQDPSALERIEVDPALRQQQMAALQQLSQLSEGGLTEADIGMMRQAQEEVGMADRGRQEAILQSLARRGTLGSGQELAARMSSDQQASNRLAADSRAAQQMAQQRALQAMAQRGALAGDIRGQEFGEDARRAQAADAINRFNTQNRQQVMAQNVGARNVAREAMSRNKQRLSEMNTGIANQQRGMHNELEQLKFSNRLGQASAAAGQAVPLASARMNATTANQQAQSRAMGGITGMATYGAGQGWFDDDPSKAELGSPDRPYTMLPPKNRDDIA